MRYLKDIKAISDKQLVYNNLISSYRSYSSIALRNSSNYLRGLPITVIAPSAFLIEDFDIKAGKYSNNNLSKIPIVKSPVEQHNMKDE